MAKRKKTRSKYEIVYETSSGSDSVIVWAYTMKQARAYFKHKFGLYRILNVIKVKEDG